MHMENIIVLVSGHRTDTWEELCVHDKTSDFKIKVRYCAGEWLKFLILQMLRTFASGYGPRPNVLELKAKNAQDETGGYHQFFVNQR